MWLGSPETYKYLINNLFTNIQRNDFLLVDDVNNSIYGPSINITYDFSDSPREWSSVANTGTPFIWNQGGWYIDGTNNKIATLTSPNIVPNSSLIVVSISHSWNFEVCCDYGQIEYSIDNGITWTLLNFNQGNGYSNAASIGWSGTQSTVVSSARLILSSNPASFRLRLRAVWDNSSTNTNPNWQIYNISLSSNFGSVSYPFKINKYPITNNEYCLFLNSIDPDGINPQSVYDSSMSSSTRGGISFDINRPAGYFYLAKNNMGDKPVNFISWLSAARFCNWLHNGGKTYKKTDSSASAPQNIGAYTLGTISSLSNAILPNQGARFRIPTLNEWVKSAYYKGDSSNAGYWQYPTQYDTEPQCIPDVSSSGYPIIFPLASTYLHTDVILKEPDRIGLFSSILVFDVIDQSTKELLVDSRLAIDLCTLENTFLTQNTTLSRLACDICVGDIVLPVITIVSQPSNIIKQSSSSLALSVSASVTLGQTLSYQWQKKNFGDSVFTNISGATSSTLTLTGLNGTDDDRDQYRCKISATGGAQDAFTSPSEIIFNTNITITQQPTNTTASSGNATFSVSATTSPETILWYQWEVAKPNDPSSFVLIGSSQNLNSTLSLSGLTYENNNNDIYRCKLATEDNTGFIYSSTATLQITPAQITITSQPPFMVKAVSGSATISVQASISMGGILSFQWQKKTIGGTYDDILGAISNVLSLNSLTEELNEGDEYRCKISGTAGATQVFSNTTVLTFNTIISITTQPSNVFSVTGSATFICSATAEPTMPLYYIWQRAQASNPSVFTPISLANNTNGTLSLSGLTFIDNNNDLYRCLVISSDNTNQVFSNTVTLTLPDPSSTPIITITTQPKNTLIPYPYWQADNNPIPISVDATMTGGYTPTYTWEYLNSDIVPTSDSQLQNNPNWEPIVSNRFLFNFDGSITDSGDFGFTPTNNNATLSTSIKKYGSSSLFCANGNVTVPLSDKFYLNTDFTIEGWFYFNTNNDGYQPLICSPHPAHNMGWILMVDENNYLSFRATIYVEAAFGYDLWFDPYLVINTLFTPEPNTWYHICIQRENNTIILFLDGQEIGRQSRSFYFGKFMGGALSIGGYSNFPDVGAKNFNGYIDSIRFVHGKAVYPVSGFAPPSSALSLYRESTPSISKKFIRDLTISGVDDIVAESMDFIRSYNYNPKIRDKRIRVKISHPLATTVYSDIIRYVVPIHALLYYGPVVDENNFSISTVEETETINDITYSIYVDLPILYNAYIALWLLDEFGETPYPSADTSWYNDNATKITLESSLDATNWFVVGSGEFKTGNPGISHFRIQIPPETAPASVYYRVRYYDTWPYDVNNGTQSASANTVYFYLQNSSAVNFKINWQTPSF